MSVETLPAASLHPRLRSIGAVYYPDRSSAQAHIYFSAPTKKWIKVYRAKKDPNAVTLEYHDTCPCSKAP